MNPHTQALMKSNSEVTVHEQHGFNQEQINVLKSMVAPQGTTNDELALFMMYCQRSGLDPFARQIYFSERRSQVNGQWTVKRAPETTIDGFRLIGERTGKYAGQQGPFWCGADGVWRDVWLDHAPPAAAKVGIVRHDFKEVLWGVALYSEYCQTKSDGKPNHMWTRMPANQLAKCAEALGLRKAFPRETSGLYTREEMGQADNETPVSTARNEHQDAPEPERAPKPQAPAPNRSQPAETQAQVRDRRIAEEQAKSTPAPAMTVGGQAVPEELVMVFKGCSTKKGLTQAHDMIYSAMRDSLGDARAGEIWRDVNKKHAIDTNSTLGIHKAAMLEMWNTMLAEAPAKEPAE